MEVKGIDVSKHNGYINWSKVKSSGIKFVIMRAGYGSNTVDPRFNEYITGALKEGIEVGVYWFSYATSDEKAREEAIKCAEVLKPYKSKIKYPVFYDFEYDSVNYARKQGVSINKTKASNFAKAFLDQIKKEGYIPGLYTNIDFSKNYYFQTIQEQYDMWIAQYTSRCTYKYKHTMWQYSEKGRVNGISGYCDMDICYKDYVNSSSNNNENDNSGESNTDNSGETNTDKEENYKTILVRELQKSLNESYNTKLSVDGMYGSKTKEAIINHPLSEQLKNKKLEHTKWLQKALRDLGYDLAVDGYFGKDSKENVEKYQKLKSLTVDGVAGLKTHEDILLK